ncbi:hypothetical protein HD806DRAFT_475961 [Xylariaceae sp. AK1471]|nr:hypothetical protein HD806DRAFT_475961 [Xylariaceae sp. AK1471]
MHSTKVLLSIAALAGTSLSQKSDSEFCSSYVSSLFSTLIAEAPTTPAAVLSFIATQTGAPPLPTTLDFEAHAEQLCSLFTELPSSLLPEFQTFAAELLDFGKSHSSELGAYITDCVPEEQISSTISELNYYFTATGDICQHTPAPGGASNGTYPTAPAPTATSFTTAILTAAAARRTGGML